MYLTELVRRLLKSVSGIQHQMQPMKSPNSNWLSGVSIHFHRYYINFNQEQARILYLIASLNESKVVLKKYGREGKF